MRRILFPVIVMLMCSCSPRHELVIGTYGEHLYRCSFDGNSFTRLGSAEAVIQVFSIGPDGSLTLQPTLLQFDSDMPSSIIAASE